MLENVKKRDNIIIFERKPEEMAMIQEDTQNKENKEHEIKTDNLSVRTDKVEKEKRNFNVFKLLEIFGQISAVIIVLYGVVANVMIPLSQHEESINDIKTELTNIDDKIDELTKFTYLNIASSDNNNDDDDAYVIPIKFSMVYIPQLGYGNKENSLSEPKWEGKNEKIASALGNENIKYTSGDLQNKRFVTMYEEGKSEVYFLGKYNENNHWDGECTLNVYSNDELISVLEGIYEDGELKKYKRIACDEKGKWTFTDREVFEEYTDGETWNYEKNERFEQKISTEYFDETEILKAEQVLNQINKKIISYYKGKVSGGKYNDPDKEACLVKYDENGNVIYLYVGRTKNGKEYDLTGEAWSISWGHANDGYYYYEGNFEGKHSETPEDWKPMTQDEIKEKVNPDDFVCPLTGLIAEEL